MRCHSVLKCLGQRAVPVHPVHGLSGCDGLSWHTFGTTGGLVVRHYHTGGRVLGKPQVTLGRTARPRAEGRLIWHSKRYPRKDFGQLASYQSNHALAYRIHYRLESVLYQLAPLPYRVNHLGGKVSMSSACLPDRGTSGGRSDTSSSAYKAELNARPLTPARNPDLTNGAKANQSLSPQKRSVSYIQVNGVARSSLSGEQPVKGARPASPSASVRVSGPRR